MDSDQASDCIVVNHGTGDEVDHNTCVQNYTASASLSRSSSASIPPSSISLQDANLAAIAAAASAAAFTTACAIRNGLASTLQSATCPVVAARPTAAGVADDLAVLMRAAVAAESAASAAAAVLDVRKAKIAKEGVSGLLDAATDAARMAVVATAEVEDHYQWKESET